MRLVIGFCLGLAVVFTACDDIEQACTEEKYGSAIVYDFPDSLPAGVSQNVKVEYILENSCGSFVEFEENIAGQTTEVRVKLLYDGCSCDLQFKEDSNYYEVKQDSVGTYLYKFYLGETDYDSYTLQVYQ
ncbi:MAG: hypothetical protein HYZ14_01195 [Bacteroidetes bacterium]|nr:hypothetical protein [Bacteroidota bacterium]